jgi:hypothetical protein
MGSGVGIAIGPPSDDDRDPRQGRVERVFVGGPPRARPKRIWTLTQVPAGRYGVTEVLAGAA